LRLESPATLAMTRNTLCAHSPLFKHIEDDLRLWKEVNINEQTMRRHIDASRITFAWLRGKAYVVHSPTAHRRLEAYDSFFRLEFTAYLIDMMSLEDAGLIPASAAAELIITVEDPVLNPAVSPESQPAVGRYNKKISGPRSPSPDIRIPSWAFRMRNFDSAFLGSQLQRHALRYPWESKRPVLFGRYTPYPHTEPRLVDRNGSRTKHTREYFVTHVTDWVPSASVDLKISTPVKKCHPFCANSSVDHAYTKVEMTEWGQYKYLLALAGVTWSGTCEMLLTLSSVPFLDTGGYATYFSSALVPFKHYVPVWVKYPDDVAHALAWAQADDARARDVARRAREFAAEHLTLRARQCYWREVILQLGLKQPYFREAVANGQRTLIPVREYFNSHFRNAMANANGATQGAPGRCMMRCMNAAPGVCTKPCMY